MKIGLVQYDPVWEDKETNKVRILDLWSEMGIIPDLLIFPELTLTGFTMRSRSFGEPLDGNTLDFFSHLAVDSRANIIFGMIEKDRGEFYNSAIHIDKSGQLTNCYRKIHPFSFTSENRFYRSGREPVMIDFNGFMIGLTICYDLRFPELFRHYAKQGCDAIINIANWPAQRIEHWKTLLKARALENLCFVFACNRVGSDKSNQYPGYSGIYSPTGELLLNADQQQGIFVFNADLSQTSVVREEFPFLNDIRLI